MYNPVLRLTTTKQDILGIFKARPGESFFVNELVRLTNRFPNSVEHALRSLEKDDLVTTSKVDQRKFFSLNPRYAEQVTAKIAETQRFDWIKLLNREASYAFNPILCRSNTSNLYQIYGIKVPTFWYNDLTRGVYYLKDEMAAVGQAISSKLDKNKDFARKDTALCRKRCDDLVVFSKQIVNLNLPKYTVKQLECLLSDFAFIYQDVFPFLMTPHAVERYFETRIRDTIEDEETLEVLLSPVSTEDEERSGALKIAGYVKKYGWDKKSGELLSLHWQSYCWLSLWTVNAEPLSREYFLEEIENILKKISDPLAEIERLVKEEKDRRETLEKTLRKIRAGRIFRDQVSLLQEYIFLRTYRKNAICRAHFYHLPLLYEIALRLGVTKDEIRLLAYDEIVGGLRNKSLAKKLQTLAQKRAKGWAILMWQGKITTITGGRRIIQAMEQYRIVPPSQITEKVLRGNTACRGKVVGKVKVVHKISEIGKVQPGDILVTKMTTPDYMIAINKCVGIITDEGGITCHAAIVSREFNIPCLVATHNATKLLKDNDIVELDATNSIARVVETTEVDTRVREIIGKPVYPGNVKGRAVIVNSAADFAKVRTGDILITTQPTPDFLSSLYRISGMVIDEDSLTAHGVLYAESLKIPTIVATGYARDVINDGEIVELDSRKGIVRRLQN